MDSVSTQFSDTVRASIEAFRARRTEGNVEQFNCSCGAQVKGTYSEVKSAFILDDHESAGEFSFCVSRIFPRC